MPITREFINGRISFSVRTPKRKGIATLAVKIPLFYKEGRKSLTTIGFFKKSGDIFFGATSHAKSGIHSEYRIFSNFLMKFHRLPLHSLGQFWVNGSINSEVCKLSDQFGQLFLCLFSQKNIRDTLGGFGFVLLDDMAVKALCCVYAGVPQLLGYRDNVRPVCQKDRGHGVPESVRIDMRQAMSKGKISQPAGDAVRVHVLAVVLGEHITAVCPSISVCNL